MKKKVLGDDPFRSKDATPPKKPAAPVNKTKRAARKTEAPKATKPAAKKRGRPADAVSVSDTVSASVSDTVSASDTASAALATTPGFVDAPAEAPTGTWRWWRARQLQLARAEESAFLTAQDPSVDRFGRDPVLAGRAEPVVDFVYRSLLRVSVRGLGHVPERGRAIVVMRRRSVHAHGLTGVALAQLERLGLPSSLTATFDAALVAHAVRTEHVAHRELRPLVRSARLYMPFLGKLLKRLGGVPADVHDLARLLDDERLALAMVDREPAAGAHPTPGGAGTIDLRSLVCIALVTGAPFVPVKMASSAQGRMQRGTTAIAFGTPLFHGAEFGPEGAEDEALVARLADELDAQL